MNSETHHLNYDPAIFNDITSLDHAKRVILCQDAVHSTDQRWKVETRWLVDKIADWMPPKGITCLDYGCGVGRVSKPLIEEREWSVMGVDISPAMRGMAVDYVRSARFLCCSPGALDAMLPFGVAFDCAIVCWTLQHCERPEEDIDRIRRAVKPGGRIIVLGSIHRFVPGRQGADLVWQNDSIEVSKLLFDAFAALRVEPVPETLVPAPPSYWGCFERATVE
jgi:SAM-dependent methyltransferase